MSLVKAKTTQSPEQMLAEYVSAKPQIISNWTFLYVATVGLFRVDFLFLSRHNSVLMLWPG